MAAKNQLPSTAPRASAAPPTKHPNGLWLDISPPLLPPHDGAALGPHGSQGLWMAPGQTQTLQAQGSRRYRLRLRAKQAPTEALTPAEQPLLVLRHGEDLWMAVLVFSAMALLVIAEVRATAVGARLEGVEGVDAGVLVVVTASFLPEEAAAMAPTPTATAAKAAPDTPTAVAAAASATTAAPAAVLAVALAAAPAAWAAVPDAVAVVAPAWLLAAWAAGA